MSTFRVLVFVTDQSLFRDMRDSFRAGGFDGPDVVYQVVDNVTANFADPYSLLNDVMEDMGEDYLLFCHQDIRLAPDVTRDDLVEELRRADRAFPTWAIAGPAGLTLDYEHAAVVRDPWNAPVWPGPFPTEAEVLDELLLVLRPGRTRLTDGLSGFHFVAADLCVSARRQGGRALVIDFPVVHLSDGQRGRVSAEYRAARDALQGALSPDYRFAVLMAITSEAVLLTRWRLVRRLADRRRVRLAAVRLLGRRVVPS